MRNPTLISRLHELLRYVTLFVKVRIVLYLFIFYRISTPNWIFDCGMERTGVMIFGHRILSTFSLILTYEEIDLLGSKIQLKTAKIDEGPVPISKYPKYIHTNSVSHTSL